MFLSAIICDQTLCEKELGIDNKGFAIFEIAMLPLFYY